MNALAGDIGNTITKICLVKVKNFKVVKIIYLDSKRIPSINYLKKKLKKIIKNKKKYHAHDEKNMFKIGYTVQIEESKPYSKYKRCKVMEESRWSKLKQNYS